MKFILIVILNIEFTNMAVIDSMEFNNLKNCEIAASYYKEQYGKYVKVKCVEK